MKKLFVLGIALGVSVFVSTTIVKADNNGNGTVDDLFKLYDKSTVEDYTDLQQEYNNAKKEYEKVHKDVRSAESFNSMYESAEVYQKEKKKQIDNSVSNLMNNNNFLAISISENLNGDIAELLKLDAKYKGNTDEINTLLVEKNKYNLTEKRKIDYKKLNKLKSEMGDLKKKYGKSVEENSLGSVKKMKFPLGAPTAITSGYGDRIDPITRKSVRFHAGIDLRADMNTEVLALFNGVVSGTGYGPTGGYFVRIDHDNNVTSYYCHLSEIKCVVGQKVKQYDTIALSGNTGSRTTAPHLHLGLYLDGNSIDPGVLFTNGE